MIYISIVGTQVMAVVNPLLSICQKSPLKIDRVRLMPTPQTIGHEEQAVQAIKLALPHIEDVKVIPISNDAGTDKNGNPPAQEAILSLLKDNEKCIFNLAGGMNFQVASCVMKLGKRDAYWAYPEMSGVHFYSFKDGALEYNKVFDLPTEMDVLTYQGVPHKVVGGGPNPFMKGLLGADYVKRLTLGVDIGGVVFDGICNVGNEMRFLKVIETGQAVSKKSEVFLAEARALTRLAAQRDKAGELYYRSVALLTNHATVAQHVEAESGGKIRVFEFNPKETAPKVLREELRKFLFGPRARTSSTDEVTSVVSGNSGYQDRALYAAMGLNAMTTLTSIQTHQARELFLLYTPEVSQIARTITALKRSPKNLPAEKVHFIPMDITGASILDLSRPEEQEIHVNITPGSKAQAAFLAKWALQNSAKVFSLFTPEQKALGLDSSASLPMMAPSPAMYLRMSGIDVASFGNDVRYLPRGERARVTAILEFLRHLNETSGKLSGFPSKNIKSGEFSFVIDGEKRTLLKKKKQVARWRESEWGGLFEKLVGHAIAECGAHHVQIRIRTRWLKEDTIRHIQEKYSRYGKKEPFMSDLDVVAAKDANYYVISCKGGKNFGGVSKSANEAAAMAHIFGRFSVPLLCTLVYEGDPEETPIGVYRFGWKTLVDSRAMKSLLETAVKKRRKTLQ